MRKLAAEAFGTFVLVFAGTGAIVVNDASGGAVAHVGVALVFGLVALALIHGLGDVSGAHLNPVVTLGFWLAGRYKAREVLPCAAAQRAGALLASGTLRAMFPAHAALGATLPAGDPWRPSVLEAILTLFLMFVILAVSSGPKEKGMMAGVAVGAVTALEALFAGPICGASMNPARSLAPTVVAWRTEHLWICLAAPPLGAALGVLLSGFIHGTESASCSCASRTATAARWPRRSPASTARAGSRPSGKANPRHRVHEGGRLRPGGARLQVACRVRRPAGGRGGDDGLRRRVPAGARGARTGRSPTPRRCRRRTTARCAT